MGTIPAFERESGRAASAGGRVIAAGVGRVSCDPFVRIPPIPDLGDNRETMSTDDTPQGQP